MGHERNVQRWDIHVALLREQLATVDAQLAALDHSAAARQREQLAQLIHARADLNARLEALGPSPRAKMG